MKPPVSMNRTQQCCTESHMVQSLVMNSIHTHMLMTLKSMDFVTCPMPNYCSMELFCQHTQCHSSVNFISRKCQSGYSFICVLTYWCLRSSLPQYLAATLYLTASVDSRSRFHSSSTSMLLVSPTHRITLGDRALTVGRACNALAAVIRLAPSYVTFQHQKTFLFTASFNAWHLVAWHTSY